MANKHTNGPWFYAGGNEYSCEVNVGETTVGIDRHDKNTQQIVISRDEMEANARLIAAAPELLEALQSVLSYEQRCANKNEPKIGNGILSQIHKAIKKATE